MNASLPRERGKGMHHISKSIFLRQIKLKDSCSASQNLSEKQFTYFSVRGVEIPIYVAENEKSLLNLLNVVKYRKKGLDLNR